MNTRSLHILLPLLLFALSLTGCNSDIFIDDDPPSAKQLEIALGEEKGIKFQTENLREISVSFARLTFDVTTYTPPDEKFREYRNLSTVYFYDIQSTLPFISRISAIESYYDIELELYRKSDGEVSIKAVKNGSGEAIHGTINLVYSYKTEKIDFTIGYEKDEAELNLSDKASGKSRHLRTEVFVTQPFYYTFHWQEIPLDEK